MSSNNYGLLVESEWCTGCHTCETACQVEYDLPLGQYGIKISELGPWQYEDGGETKWQYTYLPAPTNQCNGCAERVSAGKLPTCVHHCQAKCLKYGPVEELAKMIQPGSKNVLFAL